MSFELRVFGTPAPQGSKRHVGGGRMVEASKKVQPWREAIVTECQRTGLADTRVDFPVSIAITFYLQRPAGHRGTHGIKPSAPIYPHRTPDLDKLVRSTLDGLTQAALWVDDARVVILTAYKTYADHTGPGALIRITEMTGEQHG
ncbi:MAG: RusA family crossover junction endodeoxyribonuclease [Candidatus Nanopelagicales bacterium]